MVELQCKPFGEFLGTLIQALEGEGVRYCILRNYEGFPINNIGNDIDFLIFSSDLPHAIHALQSIEGVRIVGYIERASVASFYLEGISDHPKHHALEVDFDLNLAWKGLPFLTTRPVLQAAIPRTVGNMTFFVPSPIHEAIISFFTSLLIAGKLKEKYFPKVQRTFANDRSGVIAALLPQFGLRTAGRLVDSVIGGNRREVLECIGSLRISLALRSLFRRPLGSILAIIQHYASEFAIRLSPKNVETVCVLRSEGGGRTTIIENLIRMLGSSAGVVEKRDAWSRSPFADESRGMTQNSETHAQNKRGSCVSMARIVLWLLSDWVSQFPGKRNLTLRICESCCYDLVVDPQGYQYGGPGWFARLASKLFRSPDLWILLAPANDGMRSNGGRVPSAESRKQLESYSAFVQARKRYVILDAGQPVDRLTESAYAAIIDTLAQRAGKQLKCRFKQRKNSN
jgi:hypothetical protein